MRGVTADEASRVVLPLLFREPTGGGEIGGGGGRGNAEFLAFFFVEVFGPGPLGLKGGSGGIVVILEGTDEVAGFVGENLGDGLGFGWGFAGFEAGGDGARKGVSGDLTAISSFAGEGAGELVVEDAVKDFGEHELDGAVVFEQGNGDVAGGGEAEAALAVGDAEILSGEGGLTAHDAASGEVAATVLDVAAGCGGGGWFGRGRVGFR
ncbi:MAG: hypothetical protein WBE63_13640, partial [Acidobacteriaceae bacterium]